MLAAAEGPGEAEGGCWGDKLACVDDHIWVAASGAAEIHAVVASLRCCVVASLRRCVVASLPQPPPPNIPEHHLPTLRGLNRGRTRPRPPRALRLRPTSAATHQACAPTPGCWWTGRGRSARSGDWPPARPPLCAR